MRNKISLICLSLSASALIRAEERLSWFTTDQEIKKSIFVPDNLPEGKEENRVLPWVFHDEEESKLMQLKCIMRGYNASNNPSNYKDARWSHPGFSDSQFDSSDPVDKDDENGVPYAIWTSEINISASDAGKKWATCEFQQGDFPLSTEFKFLIFRRLPAQYDDQNKTILFYDLGGSLDEKDINQEIEDDIKRQISEHYDMSSFRVTRSKDGQKFLITLDSTKIVTTTTSTTTSPTTTTTTSTTATTTTAPATTSNVPITTSTTTPTPTSTKKSTGGGGLCDGSSSSFFVPHPTDIQKFYHCSDGKPPVEYTCDLHFLWNDQWKLCEWAPRVRCNSRLRPPFAPPLLLLHPYW